MQITTTYEIKPNHMDPKRGALIVHVAINGEEVGTLQPLSGPIDDINEYVAGEIDMAEVSRRWGPKRKKPNSDDLCGLCKQRFGHHTVGGPNLYLCRPGEAQAFKAITRP